MPKKMAPRFQAKNETLFLKYPFLAIFLYNYAICPKLSVLLRALSINNHALLYTHINNHSFLYIHININNNYHKKYT